MGDVIRLAAGDLVPADARLIEATDLHVQQAALTGESLPFAIGADTAFGDVVAALSRSRRARSAWRATR